MEIVLVGKTKLKNKQYTMSDSDGVVQKAYLGLDDNYYGGSLKEFRKTKESGIMLCVDKRDNIINLAYIQDSLTKKDCELLGVEYIGTSTEETNHEEINPIQKILNKKFSKVVNKDATSKK